MAVTQPELSTAQTPGDAPIESKPLVKSISVLRSGWAEQHTEHRRGSIMPRLWWVFTSRHWVKAPVHYFLIDHADGPVLFDTGLDPAIKTDPTYISSAIGRFLLPWIFRLHITEDDRLDRLLERKNLSARDVHTAVISHLHFDHVGGIGEIPQANLLVSAREWAQMSDPHPEYEWMLPEHINIPNAKWTPIEFGPSDDALFAAFDGIYDVAGDGAIVLLPTPGHTPGSLSMLVRSEGWPPILLVGDLAYDVDLLMTDTIPGTGDAKTLRASYATVRSLKEKLPDLVIVPSHDARAAETLQHALSGPRQG